MFPENTRTVMCPPTPAGDQVAALVAGMGGGSGMVSQKCVGGSATVYTCANNSDVGMTWDKPRGEVKGSGVEGLGRRRSIILGLAFEG